MKNEINRTLVVKKSYLKKCTLLGVLTLIVSSVWAVDPTLSINETSQGSSTYLTTYSAEGITISSTASFSSGAVQLGNTPNAYDQHYIEVLVENNEIDSISYKISGNGSNKSIQAPVFGWATTANSNTADTYRILDAVNVTANSYAAAQWFTYDFSESNVKCLRIYRSSKNISSANPSYTGGSTALGSGNTIKVYGFKIWLKPSGPVSVTGVTLNKTTTSIEAGQMEQLTATVQPSNADNKAVSWSTSNPEIATVDQEGNVSAVAPGNTTITVTTADGNKTATCNVTVTAPPMPIPVTAIALNKSTTTIAIGDSETLTIIYTPADANTGKAVTWTSSNTSVATVDNSGKVTGVAAGSATITAKSTTDNNITASCAVTVQAVAVTGVSINPTSANLQIGGSTDLTYTILPANATDKSVSWSSSNTSVATVNNGHVTAIAAGTATITVTTTDGNKTATCSVTVTAGPPVPYTDLTLHEPEVYEAKDIAGGYNTPLTVVAGHEYEVYYTQRTGEGDYPTFSTTIANEGKSNGISGSTTTTKNVGRPGDTWFEGTITEHSECKNASSEDEFVFATKMIREHRLSSTNKYQFHIKGYDQFSFWGMDKKLDPKKGNQVFVVKIDGVEQTTAYSTDKYTIRRYDITTAEHLIEISTTEETGTNKCVMGGFSLRIPKEPRTKRLKGNDSTQVVYQTTAIQPITYVTKYNNVPGAETRLEWNGNEATGIRLQEVEGDLTDTLLLSGVANCPVGTYNYAVVAYYNGVETSRATGSFRIATDIQAMTELAVDVYQNEEMDQIKFRYYALDESVVQLTWPNGQPAGIAGSGAANNTYIIGGTPTAAEGIYKFEITALGTDTTFKGSIHVKKLDYGQNPVLYLYKNTGADEKDGVYTHLKSKSWNVISRKAKEDGLRPADQYSKYKWILISEDADSDNEEVLAVVRGGISLPVLNMNAFSYAYERNEVYPNGWGEPDNGSISEGGRFITVQRDDHPIFKTLNKKKGDRIQVLDTVTFRGLMPINIKQQGTLCLATSPTRNIEDYEADGEMQTIIHEIPVGTRGVTTKYIGFPMSKHSTANLTSDGKKTLDAIVSYLLSPEPTVFVPTVQITGFSLNGIAGKIDQSNNTIQVSINRNEYPDIDLVNAQPVVTLADPQTTVTPASGDTVDLSTSNVLPVKYVVTDFINRRVYNVSVTFYSPEGIEEVYTAGDWINIYDIFGRKIATTNEDVYTMSLPRGVYIIVNENGNTFKITR